MLPPFFHGGHAIRCRAEPVPDQASCSTYAQLMQNMYNNCFTNRAPRKPAHVGPWCIGGDLLYYEGTRDYYGKGDAFFGQTCGLRGFIPKQPNKECQMGVL